MRLEGRVVFPILSEVLAKSNPSLPRLSTDKQGVGTMVPTPCIHLNGIPGPRGSDHISLTV
jgi:hypothetical protein